MATRFEEIQIEKVHANAANIRTDMGDMESLAAEVKTIGIRNPLLVYPHPELDGDFLVQDGHRRLQAARDGGALFVPCVVLDAPKRGRREDIEVMLSTGKAAKLLNPLEVSYGFEQLVADGMDETTIGKKYKVPKSEVKARARISAAPEKLKERFAGGRLTLDEMKRIQDLEDAGVPEVFEKVVDQVAKDSVGRWNFDIERIISSEEALYETEQLKAELVGQGAKEGEYEFRYNGKHDNVTDLGLSVAEHVAGKHTFLVRGDEVEWFAKRLKAKPEPTPEELEEAQVRRSLEAGLAIQGRVRRKYLVDQVHAKETPVGKDGDFELLFALMWELIKDAEEDLLAALSGIAVPETPEDTDDDTGVHEEWLARVEKAFRKMSWQQLVRAATIASNQGTDKGLGKLKGFERDRWEWSNGRQWYGIIQNQFGYRMGESERNAVVWAELQGGTSHYFSKPTEGENRNLDEDLAILDD